jgi:mono/diheme cytochrome c family protein
MPSEAHPMSATKSVLATVGLFVSLVGAACYPAVAPVPGELSASGVAWAAARWPDVTAKSLSAGRVLFVAKCNGCHGYPALGDISEQRWPGILDTMAKKAHLASDERDAVLHYVLASRAEPASQ